MPDKSSNLPSHEAGNDTRFFSMFGLPPADFKVEALEGLGTAMSVNVSGFSTIPAGYTYLGQFLVHDMSRLARGDTRSTGSRAGIDEFVQLSTPAIDLNSMYGAGFDDEHATDRLTGEMQLACRWTGRVGSTSVETYRDGGTVVP